MNFINYLPLLSGQVTSDAAVAPGGMEMLSTLIWIPLMIGVFYFLLIKPQKKRAKADKSMRDNLQVADEVVTVGGIIGRVLSVKDDTVLIETGGDRTRIRVLRSSIAENRTIHDS
ncbi:MAG: preprotein translocase subunit YajC [Oscillospiraceae bacterium]|nr:preprotein translocase subunit YajC [Oscillospiraceae bacterium]